MDDQLLALGSFAILPNLIALAVAYVLALPIGWNREKEERSAGLRIDEKRLCVAGRLA